MLRLNLAQTLWVDATFATRRRFPILSGSAICRARSPFVGILLVSHQVDEHRDANGMGNPVPSPSPVVAVLSIAIYKMHCRCG